MSITVQKVISKNPLKNQKPGFNQETLYRPVNFLFFELVVPFYKSNTSWKNKSRATNKPCLYEA